VIIAIKLLQFLLAAKIIVYLFLRFFQIYF